jgi:hypothetical protein
VLAGRGGAEKFADRQRDPGRPRGRLSLRHDPLGCNLRQRRQERLGFGAEVPPGGGGVHRGRVALRHPLADLLFEPIRVNGDDHGTIPLAS